MAIKDTNTNIKITLSKDQAKWLRKFCKTHDITASKYISWLLSKKAEEMLLLLKFDKNSVFTRDELTELLKTKWLD